MNHRDNLRAAWRVRPLPVPRPNLPAWCRHLAQQGLDHADVGEVLGLDETEVQQLLERQEVQP